MQDFPLHCVYNSGNNKNRIENNRNENDENLENRYAFTLQRSFLSEDRLTVRVMANSPFHKNQHSRTRTVQGDILGWGDNTRNENGRYFLLAFTYRFGKLKASVKKTETTIENSDEVGGISRGK